MVTCWFTASPLMVSVSLPPSQRMPWTEKIPFGAEVKHTREWDKFFGIINAFEALPPLPSGTHTLTV